MKHVLPKKLMPSFLRFALVLVGAIALLLIATPGAFAASPHAASHTSMHGSPRTYDGCAEQGNCGYLLLDGQKFSLNLNPSSNDCLTTPAGETVFECDITLSGQFVYNQSVNWVAKATNLGSTIHISPSSGTLTPGGQSVTVRIYPLTTLGIYSHGSVTFSTPSQQNLWLTATAYWQ